VNAQSDAVYANLILSLLLDGSWGPGAPGEAGTPLLGAKAAPAGAGARSAGPVPGLSDLQERQLAHPQAGTRE